MSRNQTTINKEFVLSDNIHSDDDMQQNWRWVDHFTSEVADNTPAVRKGKYTGNGLVQVVPIADCPGPPFWMAIQPITGGNPFVTLVPYATGPITAWDQSGFTLNKSSIYNTPKTVYFFYLLA